MVVASGWSLPMSRSSVFADLKMSVESLKGQGKVREICHLPPVATLEKAKHSEKAIGELCFLAINGLKI